MIPLRIFDESVIGLTASQSRPRAGAAWGLLLRERPALRHCECRTWHQEQLMACPPGLRSHRRRCGGQGRARDGDSRAISPAPKDGTATVHTVRGPQGAMGPTGTP